MARRLAVVVSALAVCTLGACTPQETVPTVTGEAVSPIAIPTSARPTQSTTATARPQGPATKTQTINPFSPEGALAAGWTVKAEAGQDVNCTQEKGSQHGLSTDTHACGPESLRTTACWRSPRPEDKGEALLCLADPWTTTLVRHPAADVPLTTPQVTDAIPVAVALADGSRWTYWGGGGWPHAPKEFQPRYECVSGCTKGKALGLVAGKPMVDRGGATWSMNQINFDDGTITPVAVESASFIASTIKSSVYPTPSAAPSWDTMTPTPVDPSASKNPSESPSESGSESPSKTATPRR